MQRLREWRAALRDGTLPRRQRWRLIGAVVAFYLVRDLVLYVAVPAVIWMSAGP